MDRIIHVVQCHQIQYNSNSQKYNTNKEKRRQRDAAPEMSPNAPAAQRATCMTDSVYKIRANSQKRRIGVPTAIYRQNWRIARRTGYTNGVPEHARQAAGSGTHKSCQSVVLFLPAMVLRETPATLRGLAIAPPPTPSPPAGRGLTMQGLRPCTPLFWGQRDAAPVRIPWCPSFVTVKACAGLRITPIPQFALRRKGGWLLCDGGKRFTPPQI